MPVSLPVFAPLIDAHQRRVSYLRVSLTDRCNFRCTYCMPAEGIAHRPRAEILTFEEIERVVRVFVGLGVSRVRLTGGEPTVRKDVTAIVARLAAISVPGASGGSPLNVVMTTNGHRLVALAEPLAEAGLREVNVSIDTVDADKFSALTRGGDLARVIAGIDAARAAGLVVKLNAVALAKLSPADLGALCDFAWARGIVPRFIEPMPMAAGAFYKEDNTLAAAGIRDAVAAHTGEAVIAAAGAGPSHGPARYFCPQTRPAHRFGIISAMTEHFCDTCNRVRISATGDLHTCLGHDDATPLSPLLRGAATGAELVDAIRGALDHKRPGHQFLRTGAGGPTKAMVAIGG
ncbi:MAG TPA: GTP 3',8-cyclase MoaA [Kofleriaceae bacterium]|nr:GTP 3',8-cyclase MoaA [Kofleriaceae bacterium]